MSDHGFGLKMTPYGKQFWVNEWLRDQGYLKTKNKSILEKLNIDRRKIRNLLIKIKLYDKIVRVVPEKVVNKIPSGISIEHIDWEKTKAYSYGIPNKIYINLEGREPSGTVSRENTTN